MSNSQDKLMLTRRQVMAAAGLAVAAGGVLLVSTRPVAAAAVDDAIKQATGGKPLQEGRITLELPEIAENGNTVPLTVIVDSPMSADDYVKSVTVFAAGNPRPEVASFHFSPRSGVAQASTRMRLAQTQDIVAIAEMSDGSMWTSRQEVKVTIGGCGG